jgi:predicted phosphodiesterase
MRVAALYDIHGNLPALEAVLHELRREGIDRLVIGGDVVPGPMSSESVDRVLNLGVPTDFVRGNGELAALAERAGSPSGVPEAYRNVVRWSGESLTPEQADAIAGWPRTVLLRIPPLGDVLFCHATPRNENEIFTKLTREERLLEIFRGLDVAMVVCGHTHMQFDMMVGGTRIVNAGSIGMPFGAPGADYLLLGPGVDLKHASYDLEGAAERIRQTRYPKAEDFASRNLLHPPSEQQILETYAQAADH